MQQSQPLLERAGLNVVQEDGEGLTQDMQDTGSSRRI